MIVGCIPWDRCAVRAILNTATQFRCVGLFELHSCVLVEELLLKAYLRNQKTWKSFRRATWGHVPKRNVAAMAEVSCREPAPARRVAIRVLLRLAGVATGKAWPASVSKPRAQGPGRLCHVLPLREWCDCANKSLVKTCSQLHLRQADKRVG